MRYRILAIVLLLPVSMVFAQGGKKMITVEDLWKNFTFKVKDVPGFNAMKDGKRFTKIDAVGEHQFIRVYDLETGKEGKTIFDDSVNKYNGVRIKVDGYTFSKDEQKMLLLTESENIYRRSILNRVYVYDLTTKALQMVDTGKVLHATLSPDGSKVAFVKSNNLYIKDLKTNAVVAITKDGMKNSIINGNCDWVYEEEFGFSKAFEWNADGNYLAYYRFDESLVPEYTMAKYTGLYPEQYKYKYPKAGERNSVVQIKIYDVARGTDAVAAIGSENDQYIPRIKWTNNPEELCVYRLNRHQNKLELLVAVAQTGKTKVIYSEENKCYVSINDDINFLPDGHSFVFMSEQTGYNHLFSWDWNNMRLFDLTPGNYDVDNLVGIDIAKKTVYYTAAETSPLERNLYSVEWTGKNKRVLTPEKGYHSITPCDGFSFFVDKYSGLNSVPVYNLRDAKGKVIRTLEDNHELSDKMKEYALGNIRFTTVKGATDNLNAWIITPPDFDSTKKYPVLMYQYSGPGSQEVADRFPVGNFFWHQMLAEKGYIVVCADGTGTGFRGEAFKKKTYLQLGKYESEDQIAAAKYLSGLPYIDKNRIGIWGWSYGGFMSSNCIFKGNEVFKMAIAVAPVTNWRYYDNIYTERYMRTPAENQAGYDDNAPEKIADKLKGKFLFIHGTADDNVHFQNSVMMANSLIKAGKDYDSEYYPDKAHGISGAPTRLHLYKRMTEFILNNL